MANIPHVNQQAHDLAIIWTKHNFDLHTQGIDPKDWDALDEGTRMDKLYETYQCAYDHFVNCLPELSDK